MKPLFSIIIPTYQRCHLWQNYKLLDSLYNQSCTDAEVIIVNDKSTDDTLIFLKNYIESHPPPFKFRLINCIAEKKNYTQSSCIPDNIGFSLAKGDCLIHLDDDGWIHQDLLKYVKSLNLLNNICCHFGNIIFVNPETFEPFSWDSRLGRPTIEAKRINPNTKIIKLKPEYKAAWGALYCIPLHIIKEIGGHSMDYAYQRGNDARLGFLIENRVPCYFNIEEAMTFWHIDSSWIRKRAAEGKSGLEEIASQHKIPFESYFVKKTEIINMPKIVNGGKAFWSSGVLDNLYKIVI